MQHLSWSTTLPFWISACRGSGHSLALPATSITHLFNYCQSNMYSNFGFILHFPDWEWVETYVISVFWQFQDPLRKLVVQTVYYVFCLWTIILNTFHYYLNKNSEYQFFLDIDVHLSHPSSLAWICMSFKCLG